MIKFEDSSMKELPELLEESTRISSNSRALTNFYNSYHLLFLLLMIFLPVAGIMTPILLSVLIIFDILKNILLPVTLVGSTIDFKTNRIERIILAIIGMFLVLYIHNIGRHNNFAASTAQSRTIIAIALPILFTALYLGTTFFKTNVKTWVLLAVISLWLPILTYRSFSSLLSEIYVETLSYQATAIVVLVALCYLPVVLFTTAGVQAVLNKQSKKKVKAHA